MKWLTEAQENGHDSRYVSAKRVIVRGGLPKFRFGMVSFQKSERINKCKIKKYEKKIL